MILNDRTIFITFISILVGMLIGIAPSMSMATGMVMLWPYSAYFTPTNLVLFLVIVASASQFFGSISALIFKVPGELSSVPTVIEAKKIRTANEIESAIVLTAVGSLVGLLVGALLFWAIVGSQTTFYWLFGWKVQVAFYTLFFVLVTRTTGASWFFSLCALILGLVLSKFNDIAFEVGVPIFVNSMHFIVFMYALPLLTVLVDEVSVDEQAKLGQMRLSTVEVFRKCRKWTFLRITAVYSVLGSVIGLIPGYGLTLASTISYSIEKRKATNDEKFNLNAVVAAETANNAAAVTVFAPLLIMGFPINVAELILYTMLTTRGVQIGTTNGGDFALTELVVFFAISAIILGIAAIYLVKLIRKHFALLSSYYVRLVVALALMVGVYDQGRNDWWIEVIIASLLYGLGYTLLKCKKDMTILLFAALLGLQIIQAAELFYYVNFT